MSLRCPAPTVAFTIGGHAMGLQLGPLYRRPIGGGREDISNIFCGFEYGEWVLQSEVAESTLER